MLIELFDAQIFATDMDRYPGTRESGFYFLHHYGTCDESILDEAGYLSEVYYEFVDALINAWSIEFPDEAPLISEGHIVGRETDTKCRSHQWYEEKLKLNKLLSKILDPVENVPRELY